MTGEMTGQEILLEMRRITGYKGAINMEGAFRMAKEAIGIIKRQQSEIERLNHIRAELSREIDRLKEACSIYEETTGLKQVRNDSIKKFADLLKATGGLYGEIWESDIDRVLKEMEDEK